MISFLAYLGVSIGLLVVGIWVMEITTKNKEWELIANGNTAAAYVLGGRVAGLAIVLYSTAANSVSIIDMVIWGSVGVVSQIILFYLAELLTPKFHIGEAIDKDNRAVGIMLMFLSISIGIVIAGCLTY